MFHSQHDPNSDIIATVALGGHKGQIPAEPLTKVAETFQLVFKERLANAIDAK